MVHTLPSRAAAHDSRPGSRSTAWLPFVVVAVSIGMGLALDLGPIGYVLASAPLAVAAQLVRRRPLRAGWVRDAPVLRITPGLVVLAGLLCLGPVAAAVAATQSHAGGTLAWVYAAVAAAGAVPAAYSMIAGGTRGLRRTVGLTIGMASIGALVLSAVALTAPGHASAGGMAVAAVRSWALYFPACFLIEEYLFRGVLQDCLPPTRRAEALVSALWGLWHLPLGYLAIGWAAVPYLVVAHVAIGMPLAALTRRTGRLTDAAAVHAAIDAIRNAALLAG